MSSKQECPDGSGKAGTLGEPKASKAWGMLERLLDSAYRELYAEVRDPKALLAFCSPSVQASLLSSRHSIRFTRQYLAIVFLG